ncbi:MAG TPA: GTP 3',8-cyclase MoaA [Terriglobales bacterium]|nr:GTP 3',8-cyclase MoaA [Terriglobales bacterium]
MTDLQGRLINYLRLSVTDRCNLRCRYCMPAEGVPWIPHEDILRFEELERIARQAVALGLCKIRVTGGEPLVRRGVIGFLERLVAIPGMRSLVLTTNGVLLAQMAEELRRAGVERLNVSLDSLRPVTFAQITRGGDLQEVLDGVAAAEIAGFPPVKINTVVMRGINEDEVSDFAELTLRQAYTVRFIEYMPTMERADWHSTWVSGAEILRKLEQRYRLEELTSADPHGPARYLRIAGAAGKIGIITPVSNHFCDCCNRLRVTASGLAKACLFARGGVDLKPYLRQGDEALRGALRQIATHKPAWHNLFTPQTQHAPFSMAAIGG